MEKATGEKKKAAAKIETNGKAVKAKKAKAA
jgi:hypothetical protein